LKFHIFIDIQKFTLAGLHTYHIGLGLGLGLGLRLGLGLGLRLFQAYAIFL
jgi:hypothetical protein